MKKVIVFSCTLLLMLFTLTQTVFAAEGEYSADISELSQADQKLYYEIFNLTHEYSGLGDNPEKAWKSIAYLMEKYPKNYYPLVAYADYIMEIERDYRRAYKLIDKIWSGGGDIIEAIIAMSVLQLQLEKNPNGALDNAKRALKLSPNNPSAMALIGAAEHELGNFSESEKWSLRAIANQNRPIRKAKLYNALGYKYSAQEKPDMKKAAESWNKAAGLAYNNSPWLLNDAANYLYRSAEEYDAAINYLKQALKLIKFNMAYINLGYAEYSKLSDSLQHPEKYANISKKPLSPKEILAKTKMTPQHAFVHFSSLKPAVLPKYLIENGYVKDIDYFDDSDLSLETGQDGTALMFAITSQNLDYIKYLIGKGANVNAVDHQSRTPIFLAVSKQENTTAENTRSIVKYLISKGANVETINKEGRGVPYFCLGNSKDILELLFQNGANPRLVDSYGVSLLGYAVKYNDVYAVRLLLEKYKISPDTFVTPELEQTAVAFAAMRGDDGLEVLKTLLQHNANPWVMLDKKDILVTLTDPINKDISGNSQIIKLIQDARKNYARPKEFFTI